MRALILLFIFASSTAFGAKILIQDGKRKTFSEGRSTTNAPDGISLRKERRVAIGFTAAGPLGVLGGNLELNFSPQWAVMGGYGTGFSYQSWTFQVKHVLAGEWLLPYLSGGVSRWYTTTTDTKPVGKDSQPAYLERFLTPTERQTGQFSQVFVHPAFGLQFMQLNGDYAGLSVFAELVLLLGIDDLEAQPTATVGMLYYF
jgi:hypothetical protein